MLTYISVILLAFIQNVAFSMTRRAGNRDNMMYLAICSVFSNGIWFLTMRQLVVGDLSYWLLLPYIIGTVSGAIFGAKVSMKIEKLIGAKA